MVPRGDARAFALARCPFASYQEGVDTSTPTGQIIFTILSAVAQLERDIVRERVRSGPLLKTIRMRKINNLGLDENV